MAQRQRVRAARAQRQRERTDAAAEISRELDRLVRFATAAEIAEEAPEVIEIVKARQALRRTARLQGQAKARWCRAVTTGWARAHVEAA